MYNIGSAMLRHAEVIPSGWRTDTTTPRPTSAFAFLYLLVSSSFGTAHRPDRCWGPHRPLPYNVTMQTLSVWLMCVCHTGASLHRQFVCPSTPQSIADFNDGRPARGTVRHLTEAIPYLKWRVKRAPGSLLRARWLLRGLTLMTADVELALRSLGYTPLLCCCLKLSFCILTCRESWHHGKSMRS